MFINKNEHIYVSVRDKFSVPNRPDFSLVEAMLCCDWQQFMGVVELPGTQSYQSDTLYHPSIDGAKLKNVRFALDGKIEDVCVGVGAALADPDTGKGGVFTASLPYNRGFNAIPVAKTIEGAADLAIRELWMNGASHLVAAISAGSGDIVERTYARILKEYLEESGVRVVGDYSHGWDAGSKIIRYDRIGINLDDMLFFAESVMHPQVALEQEARMGSKPRIVRPKGIVLQ